MEIKKLSRRQFLALSAATATGTVLAACAPAPEETPAEEVPAEATPAEEVPAEATAPPPTEAVTLHFWHWDNYLQEPYNKEGEIWAEENDLNVTVSFEPIPWEEYSQKMLAALAGGTPPDLCGGAGEHQVSLGANGAFEPLMPFIERDNYDLSDFHPRTLKQNTWMGTLVSLPYGTDCHYWYYSLEAFQEAGLKTPTEYVADPGVQSYYRFVPYIWQNGGDLFDDAYTKALINEDPSVEAFQWAFNMRPFAPGPQDEQTATYRSGRVMQWVNWDIYYVLDRENVPFDYRAAPTPASPTTGERVFIGDACSFGIGKGSEHQDLAWEFLKFTLTPESLTRLFVITCQPPSRMSMFEDDTIWQMLDVPEPEVSWQIEVERWKNFRNLPKMDNWLEMWKAEQEEISLAWVDEQPLELALDKVADRWNELLVVAEIDPDAN